MIKAIIFDFDGVLVDSVDIKTQAFAELYKDYGQEIVKSVIEYHLRNGGVSRYEKFKYYHEVLLGKKLTDDETKELGKQFSVLVEDMVVESPWIKSAKVFLDRYHKKVDLYVVSGTPDEELNRIIRDRKMSHFFKMVYGSDKKKGEIANTIVKDNQYLREEVLMVGDSMSDYEGACDAGLKFIGFVRESQESPFPSNVLTVNDHFNYIHLLFSHTS